VVFIVLAVVDQWSHISSRLAQISVVSLIVGTIGVLVGLAATMLCWRVLLSDLGSKLPPGPVAQIFFAGQLGKYVPGSIWPVVVQAELSVERGAGRKRPVAATLVQMGITVVTGVLIAAATLPFVLAHTTLEKFAVPVAIVLGLLATHPRVANRAVNTLLRLIGRQPLEQPLTWRGMLLASFWQSVGWVLFGVPVILVTYNLGGTGLSVVPLGVGALALSLVAGLVVPFAPAGAGVRELIMLALLSTAASGDAALTVALFSRLLMTIGDVIVGGAAILSLGWRHFGQLRRRRAGVANSGV
jgi:uncharacterized membrane protein YbhN (UPF0104 family)